MSATLGPDTEGMASAETVAGKTSAVASGQQDVLGRGAALGRYMVVGELGSGGMGIVYSAFDPDLDRKVALKVLRKSRDPAARARLLREAQAMAKLSHPNVVTVFEVATDGDRDFVSMEYVDGQSLDDWSREEREVSEILEVYRQAGQGLAAAHRAGLVHRDFKPHNVLIDTEGRVRVTDFGLAQQTRAVEFVDPDGDTPNPDAPNPDAPRSKAPSSLTQTGAVMGTPGYMAPEQHLAEPTDARTDQYSFCVALYQALSGKMPHEAESYAELKEKVVGESAPALPESVAVPAKVRAALATGMSRHSDARHASMDDLLPLLQLEPSRKGTALAFGLGVLVLVGLVVFGMRASNDSSACVADRSQLDGVWDEAMRGKVRTAFAMTQVAGAEQVFGKFESIADDYADKIVAMRMNICRAGRGTEAVRDESLLQQMSCLQGRRQSFAALTKAFSNVDPRGVERVVEAALGLAPVADCANSDMLEQGVAAPLPGTQAEVEELRALLTEARSQAEAGHIKDAIAKAQTARDRSIKLAYKPLLAEAYTEVGNLYRREARVREAEAAYEEAILAAEESGYTEYRARALVGVTRLIAQGSSRYEDARRYARRAQAAISQWGGDRDPVLSIEVEQAMARILSFEGHLAESQQLLEAALERYRVHYDAQAVHIAKLQNRIAGIKIELGDYEEAHKLAQSSYELVRQELGDSNPRTFANLSTLSSTHRMRGEYDEAHRLDKVARAYWESESAQTLLQEDDAFKAASRSLRGRVLDSSGAPVAGATVVCGERVMTDGRYLDAAWDAAADALERKRTTESQSDGRYHCQKTSALKVIVVAEHRSIGRSPMATVPPELEGPVDLVLAAAGSLRGKVVKDGRPGQAQSVSAVPMQPELAQPAHASITFLRGDGTYSFENLAPGSYVVFSGPRASTARMRLHSKEVEVKSGEEANLDFDQSDGDAGLHLIVRGEEGAAMPSAQVLLLPGHMPSNTGKEFNAAVVSAGANVRSRFVLGGETLEVAGLEGGLHSICIVPLGGDYRDPEHMKLFTPEALERVMVHCQDVEIAPGEIAKVETEVPAWKPIIKLEPPADLKQ